MTIYVFYAKQNATCGSLQQGHEGMVLSAICSSGVVCTEVGRSVGARVAACGSVHSLFGHFAVTRSQAVLFHGGLYFLPSTSIRCLMQFYTRAAEHSKLVMVRK
jgi:hypothetical protein